MNWRVRVQTNTIAILVAMILTLFALGFAGYAIYLSLLGYFVPNIAALLTALSYLLFAGLVVVFAKWLNWSRATRTANRKLPETTDELEAVIQQMVDPAVHQWVRRNPVKSIIVTLVAGVVIGSNRELQQTTKSVFQRFFGDD